jgi:putative nucleotidyltransferase with HDIG domain
MASQIERALHSRVAIRIAGLFIVCAIVPLVGLAVVTVGRTTRELESRARDQLRHDVKSSAMDAYGRLDLQRQTLQVLGVSLASGALAAPAVRAQLAGLFGHQPALLAFVPDRGTPMVLAGMLTMPPLSAAERAHLEESGSLLVPSDVPGRDVLLARVDAGPNSGVVLMSVDYAVLLGLGAEDFLPPNTGLCITRSSRSLGCSAGVSEPVVERVRALGPDADVLVQGPGDGYLVRTWALPLRATYGAGPMVFAMMRSRASVRAPLSAFFRSFWSLVALTILGVVWLTIARVRRQMRPLVALLDATRRLGRRDFGTTVAIASGDEFEELGAAFDTLAQDLRRQFEELEAFSLGTLEALARTIDAKSPWTAGHSSRVTELAVALASELALDEDVVMDLRRGGLVHDIGKLATPVYILDKPGPLTPDEERVLREHPTQGVHILEPVPAFRRLLPIVEQHHERWDGTGYPAGRAGTGIALTARVLAVADVFDAMRSDRPYRAGLPFDDVRAAILAGAGTHFDPAVVEAFGRLMARGGSAFEKTPGVFLRKA